MCKCTPEMRTPWCGKPGCEEPAQVAKPLKDKGRSSLLWRCLKCGAELEVGFEPALRVAAVHAAAAAAACHATDCGGHVDTVEVLA
jgi:hypothetical protein